MARDLVGAAGGGLDGFGLKGEGVAARGGLGEAEGANGAGGEAGKILLFEGGGAVGAEGGVDEGIVDVDQDGDLGLLAEFYGDEGVNGAY